MIILLLSWLKKAVLSCSEPSKRPPPPPNEIISFSLEINSFFVEAKSTLLVKKRGRERKDSFQQPLALSIPVFFWFYSDIILFSLEVYINAYPNVS